MIIRTAGPIDFPADRILDEGGDKQQQAMVHEEVVALLPIESTVQTPAKQQQQVEYAKDLQLHGSKAKAAAVVVRQQPHHTPQGRAARKGRLMPLCVCGDGMMMILRARARAGGPSSRTPPMAASTERCR